MMIRPFSCNHPGMNSASSFVVLAVQPLDEFNMAMPAPISATMINGILCSLTTGTARKVSMAAKPIRPAIVLNLMIFSFSL